ALVERDEATVRDGDAMGVAGEIGKHCFWPGEGRLGVDEPSLPLERCETCGEGLAAMQVLDFAKEREPACRVGVERRQEQPPEQAGQHSHRQEKAGLAAHPARPVERYPTARHNHMDVRMVGHCRAPAVEHSYRLKRKSEYVRWAIILLESGRVTTVLRPFKKM